MKDGSFGKGKCRARAGKKHGDEELEDCWIRLIDSRVSFGGNVKGRFETHL